MLNDDTTYVGCIRCPPFATAAGAGAAAVAVPFHVVPCRAMVMSPSTAQESLREKGHHENRRDVQEPDDHHHDRVHGHDDVPSQDAGQPRPRAARGGGSPEKASSVGERTPVHTYRQRYGGA